MDIKFDKCEINQGLTIVEDNSNNNGVINILNSFPEYLNELLNESNDIKECSCASKAKEYYTQGKNRELKNYVIDNISTFATGSFATVAGGMLLEAIKHILKI